MIASFETRFQDHGNIDGARGIVADLNVGVKELHMAQPLAQDAQDDALAYYVKQIWVDNDGNAVIL